MGGLPAISLFFAFALLLGVAMTLPMGAPTCGGDFAVQRAHRPCGRFRGLRARQCRHDHRRHRGRCGRTLLTQLMAKAMNRSLGNVLFSNFGESSAAGGGGATEPRRPSKPLMPAWMMAYSQKIIIVPGYGMAVAQAQHKVWELAQLLIDHGVKVRFAIHPVAGRMPGHMNVLLAEAGVPYDLISDLDEINAEFETPMGLDHRRQRRRQSGRARQSGEPDIGMPILNADKAKTSSSSSAARVRGFSGIDNALFSGSIKTRHAVRRRPVGREPADSSVKAAG